MSLVYVDNISVISPSKDAIGAVKTNLHDLFKIKDLGEVRYFLGIEISRDAQVFN